MPADLKETNSKCSPRFPKVIIEANKTASGNAKGTMLAAEYIRNSAIMYHSIPLPNISSTQSQINCINNTNTDIKKVRTNGPIKEINKNLVSFFTSCFTCYKYILKLNKFTKKLSLSFE